MKNKLFIIEGLPCTGKSTTGKFVSDFLSKEGYAALYYDESDLEHPADYGFHAFMTSNDLQILSDEELQQVKNIGLEENSGLVIPLSKISGELFDKIIPFKIYDCLPWEIEKTVMLNHWAEFARQAYKEDKIYVFNCCFLQNLLCEMMIRFNYSYDEIQEYIINIYENIKALNPVVIYLKNPKVKERVSEIAIERDDDWLKSVVEYHTSQGYGKANGLEGFDGYISCLEERQKLELKILEQLNIDKIIIDTPFENWERTHNIITDFIKSLEDL
ncbi:P-loop NTPase family protein [Clostridium saccharoperbutylacetonicum]